MSNLIKKDGFNYSFNPLACSLCQAKCCTGESGYIYVNQEDIKNISNFLNLTRKEFIDKFLYKTAYNYSIKERRVGDSYECAFYDRINNGCSIYEHRPSQCISFPFWDYFLKNPKELKNECIGVIFDE